jgi:hypothetical protein
MRSQPQSSLTSPSAAPSKAPSEDVASDDLLVGFDEVLAQVAERDHQESERGEEEREEREAFLTAFQEACQSQARPAMEVVIERLTAHGGGGVIEEHPGGEPRFRHPSLILWMSLEGGIVGEPRVDREPYLQLEANVAGRNIEVTEGDMWRGAGGKRSGPVGHWQLSELTKDRVIQELLAIARRSAV